ncbi:YggS family pyridoxal phosphate-dependent enzyme [bacterium]|nr:YggS family pyridoxal phosphate-dependent enzyme [bacterium]
MSAVEENIARLRERVPAHVRIMGVVKKQPVEKIQAAIRSGVTLLGVNYAQEGEALQATCPAAHWHFIGHIQSRKTKYLLQYEQVQSLDRLDIAEDLNQRALALNKTLDVLVQINIGDEQTKSGIALEELEPFAEALGKLPGLRCRGLMVLPPPLEPVEKRRPFFQKARRALERFDALGWDQLSMGTSEDFQIAVDEGATIIRLGTVLFGPRA